MADKNLPDYLDSVLTRLAKEYADMNATFDRPALVCTNGIPWFRYAKQSDTLLCFLKGIKLISTLNAAIVLLRAGYAQEIGVLCRVADDCSSDIMFVIQSQEAGELSKRHEQFIKDFFQEEFIDPNDVLGSQQKRVTVSRNTIHAGFAKLAKQVVNPSDFQNVQNVIHGAFSGYVHGAYPHIMELYGGAPGQFHMAGMLGTPRVAEFSRQLIDQVYRAIMASELVSRKIGFKGAEEAIRAILVEFENALGCLPESDPETLLRNAKRKS